MKELIEAVMPIIVAVSAILALVGTYFGLKAKKTENEIKPANWPSEIVYQFIEDSQNHPLPFLYLH